MSAASGEDDIRRERDQFRRVFAAEFGIAQGPADVDLNVAAMGPAQPLKRLLKFVKACLRTRILRAREHADTPQSLLRARLERPSRRAAETCELSPPHIRPGSADGIVRLKRAP